jgi:hypothetical protein
MKISFEKVLDGINRYIDREIYQNLSDVQELVARVVMGRVNQNAEAIKQSLMSNGVVKTLCIIDSDGMVDVDRLLQDIRKEIDRKGSIQVEVPMIGKLTFKPEDTQVLREEIYRGYENH